MKPCGVAAGTTFSIHKWIKKRLHIETRVTKTQVTIITKIQEL